MTHVIISLDDQPDGSVSIKTLAHPARIGDPLTKTPATELGDFLIHAIDVWQTTKDMDMPKAAAFVQFVTRSLNDPSNSDASAIYGGRKPTIN